MKTVVETWPAASDGVLEPAGPFTMDAELAPNRSLPNPAFTVLMLTLAGVSFFSGILFVSMGAWPVMPFFGLDALLVWFAFRTSYRDGRAREWVQVGARDIAVTRQHPTGHRRHYRLPTAWANLRHLNKGEHHSQVVLVQQGRALVLGAFLSPKERDEFAAALGAAIERARTSPFLQHVRDQAQESGGSQSNPA
ncbi:DUF2244 domain-containing protein [Maricaulis sp.]|uniref:DUF2244 domain-containing protein n=1 Tax=Maricaulis sp. TaxID=1486257 RepID=UPI003A956C6E